MWVCDSLTDSNWQIRANDHKPFALDHCQCRLVMILTLAQAAHHGLLDGSSCRSQSPAHATATPKVWKQVWHKIGSRSSGKQGVTSLNLWPPSVPPKVYKRGPKSVPAYMVGAVVNRYKLSASSILFERNQPAMTAAWLSVNSGPAPVVNFLVHTQFAVSTVINSSPACALDSPGVAIPPIRYSLPAVSRCCDIPEQGWQ